MRARTVLRLQLAAWGLLQAVAAALGERPVEEVRASDVASALRGLDVGEERSFRISSTGPGGEGEEPLAMRVQRFRELPQEGHACPDAPPATRARWGVRTLELRFLPRPLSVSYLLSDGSNAAFVAKELEEDLYGLRELSVVMGDVIVDVGANVGMFAMIAALLFPHARVIALEPVPDTFALLCHNVRANGLSNVRPLNLGVTRDWREVEIFYTESKTIQASALWRTLFVDAAGADVAGVRAVRARTCTLSDVLFSFLPPEGNVALLKVDCEGCEHEAFAETALPSLLHRVRSVRGELHLPPSANPLQSYAGFEERFRDKASRATHLLQCLEQELTPGPGVHPTGLKVFRCDEP